MNQHSEEAPITDSFSYVMRSSEVPGRRGSLKEDSGFCFLSSVGE